MKRISPSEYQAMAELRFRIRLFLREGDAAARSAGLEPQQYLLLLAIRGLPEGSSAKIQALADSLLIRHHSAVELVDRLEKNGYVRRNRGKEDRREVLVSLLPKGQRVLDRVIQQRISELRSGGRQLIRALDAVLSNGKR
ncbi:MAG TPA: MarR family transcriptional regulator [Candidatus Eisenbacteria bacterium]|jgi:DNA-binding MarR family transcriptional regulator|nr:MarR family transcriptional regulator [Candidatus Eisenbacteria bacterium]